MKKIYSVLFALAGLFTAGNVCAQTLTMVGDELVFEGPWTPEAINYELGKGEYDGQKIISVNLLNVTGLDGTAAIVVSDNPNAMIIANEGQIWAEANVLIPVYATVNGEKVITDYTCDNFVLDDNYDWLFDKSFYAKKCSYKRYVRNQYNTLCLPFDFTLEQLEPNDFDVKIEVLSKITQDTLYLTPISSLPSSVSGGHFVPAMTPIVCKVDFDGEEGGFTIACNSGSRVNQSLNKVFDDVVYNLVGQMKRTLISEDVNADMYYIQDNCFWNLNNFDGMPVAVPAFRCLLANNAVFKGTNTIKVAEEKDEEATAINDVKAETETPAYNLMGVRVDENSKGFVIKNGKKAFNK